MASKHLRGVATISSSDGGWRRDLGGQPVMILDDPVLYFPVKVLVIPVLSAGRHNEEQGESTIQHSQGNSTKHREEPQWSDNMRHQLLHLNTHIQREAGGAVNQAWSETTPTATHLHTKQAERETANSWTVTFLLV